VNLLEAALLGLTQGLTEFLPISSTAHLRIVPALLGKPDAGAAFTAVLQLGTLVAVVAFFFRDLVATALAFLDRSRRRTPEGQRLVQLVVGTVPIGIAGVLFKDAIEGPLRSLLVIATSLIVVGIIMAVTERLAPQHRSLDTVTMKDALLIGAAQALALIPGVSRSGITIVGAMMLGLRRDAAARFSFLLSIPAVTAAGIFELPEVIEAAHIGLPALLVGVVVAGISGYLSIAWLLRFLRTRTTYGFVVYRVLLGLGLVASVAFGWM
jgi:undecaprenyl-diphosphatase